MRLYRAVSQAELRDIIAVGAFHLNAAGFASGKWFAFNLENAEDWGCRFAGFDGLNYYIVEAEVAEVVLNQLNVIENLDNIGKAVFVNEIQLSELTVTATPTTYILCKDGIIRGKSLP